MHLCHYEYNENKHSAEALELYTHTHTSHYYWIALSVAVYDFIVDELGRPINRKKGGDQSTDV